MKRKLTLAVVAAIALTGSVSARAQTAFDGFYVGAGGGGDNSRRTLDLTATPALSVQTASGAAMTTHVRSVSASVVGQAKVFAGYNMSFDRWVVGAELAYRPDFGSETEAYIGNFVAGSSRGGTYSAVARLGYLVEPDLMVYGFGGWSGQQVNTTITGSSNAVGTTRFASGFTVGIGAEYALTSSWFLRGEVQYTDISTKGSFVSTSRTGATSKFNVGNDGNRFGGTLSIGYRF